MKVAFKNPKTGELKAVKIGFSWVLVLFSGVFGLPLFLRQLYGLGAFMAAWRVFVILISIIPMSADAREGLVPLLLVVDVGLVVWLGLKGNEYTGKNLLNHGWVFAKPDSLEAQFAASRWGIELPAAATA